MTTLLQLIEQAKAAAGGGLCAAVGHDWRSIGGRVCPRAPDDALGSRCSQTVYECARCEEVDYGDPGGPGYRDCFERGPCDYSCAEEFA